MNSGESARAALPTESCPFSCVMLLAVHGAVFIDVDVRASSESSALRPLALDEIGREGGEADVKEDDRMVVAMKGMSSRTGSGGKASVVSLVSPSNLGYSVMISEHAQFPNHAQVFIKMLESEPTLDENSISRLFNSYETKLYSLFGERTKSTRHKDEARAMARESDMENVDITKKILLFNADKKIEDDIYTRMQGTRDALGLNFRPHRYAIGNKEYCPGDSANQCCLYFPGVNRDLHNALISRLLQYRKEQKEQKEQILKLKQKRKLGLHSLSDNLFIDFDSHDACVLIISFDNSQDGFCTNSLWKGVSLDRFFRQIKELLHEIFHSVKQFDAEQLMSSTCVVDAACSDFAVRKKGVSIVSFTKERGGTMAGRVSALVDIHDRSEERLGFWEYWIRHNPAEAARRAGAAAAAVPRRFNHSVVIPRVLEDFVPACLTCRDLTIQKVEPVFDSDGNVVRVVYTYYDGETEEIDYVPSMPAQPTQSTEAVQGSISMPDSMNDGGGDDGVDDKSVYDSDGGRRRRLLRRTIKKKCMKKCKTKRMRRRLLRQRCNMSQKNAVKTRGRRTCVRRRL